jgi:hypothetical protein
VVVLAIFGEWRKLRPLAVPAALGLVAVLAFGLGPTLLARVTEVENGDSSASLRFVQPYSLFARELTGDPLALLLGRGAGAADSYVATVRAADLQAPVLTKILFEYGLVVTLPLLALLCSLFFARVPTWVLGVGLALVYWGVNASLLVPLLPFTLFTFLTLWAPLRDQRPPRMPEPPEAIPPEATHPEGRDVRQPISG